MSSFKIKFQNLSSYNNFITKHLVNMVIPPTLDYNTLLGTHFSKAPSPGTVGGLPHSKGCIPLQRAASQAWGPPVPPGWSSTYPIPSFTTFPSSKSQNPQIECYLPGTVPLSKHLTHLLTPYQVGFFCPHFTDDRRSLWNSRRQFEQLNKACSFAKRFALKVW